MIYVGENHSVLSALTTVVVGGHAQNRILGRDDVGLRTYKPSVRNYLANIKAKLTNDDDRAILPADRDIGTGLVPEAGDVGTFGADNPWEHGSIRQSEEANMRHALSVLNRFLNELLSPLQSWLVASPQGPGRNPVLCVLVV